MRRAAKVDANQAEIVKAMRSIGAAVTLLHAVGGGVSDLLVSWRQRWFVMEVKRGKGKLTPDQVEWIGQQKAPVYIPRTPEEAVQFLMDVRP